MFCHLHVRSGFTFLFGTFTPEQLVERAAEVGMEAVAITDKMGLYGAVRFYVSASRAHIKPIIGAEVVLGDRSVLVLLAKDMTGYSNLCRLLTEANLNHNRIITLDLLSCYANGLFCLTGGRDGRLWKLVKYERIRDAEGFLVQLKNIFKENLFVELQNHKVKGDIDISDKLNSLCRRLGIAAVVTNNVTYLAREDYRLHRALVEVQRVVHHRCFDPVPTDEFYLKSEQQIRKMISHEDAIQTTKELARSVKLFLPIGKIHPPDRDRFDELVKLCYLRLPHTYSPVKVEVLRRLEKELSLIEEKRFSSYFLIAHDIFEFAKSRGIRCSVRGSAAGSVVTYLLFGGVDPVRYNLLFERFLNEGRLDPPDIDLDFDSERREEVIRYVLEKNRGKAALVATHPTYRARGAVRDIGRALGLSYEEIDRLTQFLRYHLSPSQIQEAMETFPEFKGCPLKDKKELLDIVRGLDDIPKQISVHLGGVAICQSLMDLVPLEPSPRGYPLCQYDKEDLEKLGVCKFDVLGLRMHTAIAKALEVIRQSGVELDIDRISFEDEKTYNLLRSTQTVGVFQVESPGQRQLLGRLQPRTFSDIIAEISLFRPGPMQADMIEPFLKRRHGKQRPSYIHPKLVKVLRETGGILIFQEQVLRIVHELTGLGYDWADDFRRSMTKDRSDEEMQKLKDRFMDACIRNGIKEEVAEEAYRQVSSFAAYGFCKAHAASFAYITYQSAYLKAHYPLEFYIGLLNAGMVGTYPVRVILNEAKRRFPVYPPHVNYSVDSYRVESGGIRVPLSVIKGIGPRLIERIISERERNGLFTSISDFKSRTEVPSNALSALLNSGAMEGLDDEKRYTSAGSLRGRVYGGKYQSSHNRGIQG